MFFQISSTFRFLFNWFIVNVPNFDSKESGRLDLYFRL
jgi:hypothetical protein